MISCDLLGPVDVGVGVAQRRLAAVFNEERQHGTSALRASGNVVFFEDLTLAS
jgi:hypothetical protein